MGLEKRVERIEQALTPGTVTVCLSKYPCESDGAVRQRALRALGRPFTDGDIQLTLIREWLGFECPTAPHAHEEDAQIWPRAS
jgi:hypothetical protein